MSSRDELREALAKALAGSHGPGTIIDAVLAVLDQHGWGQEDGALPRHHFHTGEVSEDSAAHDWWCEECSNTSGEPVWPCRLPVGTASLLGTPQSRVVQRLVAERDAALREVARYEQVLEAWIKRQSDGWEPEIEHAQWVIERWRRTGMSSQDTFEGYDAEPMTEAEQEVMASLYRRVTTAGDGS